MRARFGLAAASVSSSSSGVSSPASVSACPSAFSFSCDESAFSAIFVVAVPSRCRSAWTRSASGVSFSSLLAQRSEVAQNTLGARNVAIGQRCFPILDHVGALGRLGRIQSAIDRVHRSGEFNSHVILSTKPVLAIVNADASL
ncbi:hypothetical protein QP162_04280 [Sphingomonas aurantiaca]|uniref:hypothetical protein n=1 Tax=Sphingomonas aurantiaca TaxID=185949 RepID=UPI002FDF3DB6